jgi:hypothetical protein
MSASAAWRTEMTETKPKRRWFTFSIRDLLWLTLVVGMVAVWLVHRQRMNHLNNLRWETSTRGEVVIEFTDTGARFFLTRIDDGR